MFQVTEQRTVVSRQTPKWKEVIFRSVAHGLDGYSPTALPGDEGDHTVGARGPPFTVVQRLAGKLTRRH